MAFTTRGTISLCRVFNPVCPSINPIYSHQNLSPSSWHDWRRTEPAISLRVFRFSPRNRTENLSIFGPCVDKGGRAIHSFTFVLSCHCLSASVPHFPYRDGHAQLVSTVVNMRCSGRPVESLSIYMCVSLRYIFETRTNAGLVEVAED